MKQKQYKPKKCGNKECQKEFIPFSSFQRVCNNSVECALKFEQQKKEAKEEKAWRQHKKKWKEENKSYNNLVKEAEIEFNAFGL